MKVDAGTVTRVKRAMRRAERSATAAVREFMRTAKLDSEGLVVDACGRAQVRTDALGTPVTEALKELGIVGEAFQGHYSLSLDVGVHEQSISLWSKAAQA